LNDPEAIARFQSVLQDNLVELYLDGNVSFETSQQALQQAIDTTPLRGLFTATLTADLTFAPSNESNTSSERGDDESRFLEDPRWAGDTSFNSEDDASNNPPPAVRAYATADGTIYGVDGFVNTDSDDEEEAFWTAQAAEIRRLQAQEPTPETTAERINLARASYERTTLDRASHVRSLTADLSAQEWEEHQQHVNRVANRLAEHSPAVLDRAVGHVLVTVENFPVDEPGIDPRSILHNEARAVVLLPIIEDIPRIGFGSIVIDRLRRSEEYIAGDLLLWIAAEASEINENELEAETENSTTLPQ
jgi:hypothetical protein